MPLCGCFHSYELVNLSASEYRLTFPSSGLANIQQIMRLSQLATSVTEVSGSISSMFRSTFNLAGVTSEDHLRRTLDALKNKIIVDLSPEVDQCYSLGPYSVFDDDGGRSNSLWGQPLYRAKYLRDVSSSTALLDALKQFIQKNEMLEMVDCIVSAPKSDLSTPDLAGSWAEQIAVDRSWQRLTAYKTRAPNRPQKMRSDTETEEDLVNRVADSIKVEGVAQGSNVLVLDDIIGSGGTIKEIGRALRESGAAIIAGLSVAKDARDTRGGVDLNKELWE